MPQSTRDDELARLRQQPDNVHLAGGYGPMIVGAVLLVLMVLLAPTIAPEKVVERPVRDVTTTTVAPSSGNTSTSTSTAVTAAP